MILADQIRNYLKSTGDGYLPSDFRNAFGAPGILVMDALRKMGDEVFKTDDGRWYLTEKTQVEFPEPSIVGDAGFSDPISAVAVFEPNPEIIESVVDPVSEPVEIKKVVDTKKSEAAWMLFRDWMRKKYNAGNVGYTIRAASIEKWNGKKECRVRDTIRAIDQLRRWGSSHDIDLLENMMVESKLVLRPKTNPVAADPNEIPSVSVETAIKSTLVDELEELRSKFVKSTSDPISVLRWASICDGINGVLKELSFSADSHLRIGMSEMESYFLDLSSPS